MEFRKRLLTTKKACQLENPKCGTQVANSWKLSSGKTADLGMRLSINQTAHHLKQLVLKEAMGCYLGNRLGYIDIMNLSQIGSRNEFGGTRRSRNRLWKSASLMVTG